jgi:hypothetical protein
MRNGGNSAQHRRCGAADAGVATLARGRYLESSAFVRKNRERTPCPSILIHDSLIGQVAEGFLHRIRVSRQVLGHHDADEVFGWIYPEIGIVNLRSRTDLEYAEVGNARRQRRVFRRYRTVQGLKT